MCIFKGAVRLSYEVYRYTSHGTYSPCCLLFSALSFFTFEDVFSFLDITLQYHLPCYMDVEFSVSGKDMDWSYGGIWM
jgi:hypothetical protein